MVKVYQNFTKEEALKMLLTPEKQHDFKFEVGDYITDSRLDGAGSVYQVVVRKSGWENRYHLMTKYNQSETISAYDVDKYFRKATEQELEFYGVEL